jgi:hypothetical protein
LDSWKSEGILKCWLHREPPWERRLHNFRRMEVVEDKGGPKKKILWLPFSCWEGDEYHRRRRSRREDPIPASICPGCKLIEHLEERDDIADDDVIFLFKATGREKREILKCDFIGQGDTRDSYMDDFTAKTDYILAVIPDDNPVDVLLTNEKWSLGSALLARIEKDCKLLGDDEGDPERTPICYTFEYDDKAQKYGVSRFPEAKLTDEIQRLWEGPAPDATRFAEMGDPKQLLESMTAAMEAAKMEFPLDDIFAAALSEWEKREDSSKEEESKGGGSKSSKGGGSKSSKSTTKGETSKGKKNGETKPTKPTKPTRGTKKKEEPEPEPEPPKDEVVYSCENCNGDWPESEPKCPHCGAEAEVDGEAPSGPGDLPF